MLLVTVRETRSFDMCPQMWKKLGASYIVPVRLTKLWTPPVNNLTIRVKISSDPSYLFLQ